MPHQAAIGFFGSPMQCNLSVVSFTVFRVDNTWGSPISCSVHLHNAGATGNQKIEWEIIRNPDSAIMSSGNQNSGNVPAFGSANVNLNGLNAPDGEDMLFRIRARIVGSSIWIYSFYMYNYLPSPPQNPPPRDPPPPPG